MLERVGYLQGPPTTALTLHVGLAHRGGLGGLGFLSPGANMDSAVSNLA